VKDTPVILTNHNVESLRIYRWMQIEKNLFSQKFLILPILKVEILLNRASARNSIDALSSLNMHKNYLRGFAGNNNFVVIPNGVDTDYFKPESVEVQRDRLVWVGGMTGPYNSDAVDFFIQKIWPPCLKIRLRGPRLISRRGPTQALRDKASEDKSVQVLGFVPDIRLIVQRASVFVAPGQSRGVERR